MTRFTPVTTEDLKRERYDAFWTHWDAYRPKGWRGYQVHRNRRDLAVSRALDDEQQQETSNANR